MARSNLRHFFVDGDLHKVLHINRPTDLVIAWNFPQKKRVAYVWSDLRKSHGKAFSLAEVAKMFGRNRVNIEEHILSGNVKRPQQTYALNGTFNPGKYMLSEEEVYELHDYLLTIHIGRPRKDGKVTPGRMPSRAELRAMMRHNTTMYVKNSKGEFVPVWKEVDW